MLTLTWLANNNLSICPAAKQVATQDELSKLNDYQWFQRPLPTARAPLKIIIQITIESLGLLRRPNSDTRQTMKATLSVKRLANERAKLACCR